MRSFLPLLVLLLLGCSSPPPGPVASPVATSTPAKPSPATLVDVNQLGPILDHVKAMVGGPIRFMEMRVDSSSFEIQVQDPNAPEKVDSYQMRAGEELEKVPVQTTDATAADISKASMSLDELRLEALPELLEQTHGKGDKLKGAGKPSLFITRSAKGDPEWHVTLPSTEKTVDLKADLSGKVSSLELR